MATALFAFDDPAAGRQAHAHLRGAGLPESALVLHAPDPREGAKLVDTADELVTGGMLRSLQHLLEGLFDGEAAQQDASAFTETAQRGGAVLRVAVATRALQDTVERVVETIGCSRRTAWNGPAR